MRKIHGKISLVKDLFNNLCELFFFLRALTEKMNRGLWILTTVDVPVPGCSVAGISTTPERWATSRHPSFVRKADRGKPTYYSRTHPSNEYYVSSYVNKKFVQ